jgi:hypothetical protein
MIFESREVGLFNFRSGEFFAIKKFVKNQKLPRGPLITLSLSHLLRGDHARSSRIRDLCSCGDGTVASNPKRLFSIVRSRFIQMQRTVAIFLENTVYSTVTINLTIHVIVAPIKSKLSDLDRTAEKR